MSPEGGAKDTVSEGRLQAWEATSLITLDQDGEKKRNNFHNGAALSDWKTQLWANGGHSMRLKLKIPFSGL